MLAFAAGPASDGAAGDRGGRDRSRRRARLRPSLDRLPAARRTRADWRSRERFPDFPLAAPRCSHGCGAIGRRIAGSVDFAHDVRPWLGQEAALALLNTSSPTAGSLIVLDVADRAARAALSRGAAPEPARRATRSAQILRYARGTDAAFVSHYLAFGQAASVRAAIDARQPADSPSLLIEPAYQRAAPASPADRVLDVYVSGAGVRRLLAPRAASSARSARCSTSRL